jgi:hypothetical protein
MVKHQFFPRMGVFLSGASLPGGISGTRRSGFGHRRHDFWFGFFGSLFMTALPKCLIKEPLERTNVPGAEPSLVVER